MKSGLVLKIFVAVLLLGGAGFWYIDQQKPSYTYDNAACKDLASPYDCFAEYYKNLVRDFGTKVAVADVKRISTEDGQVLAQCHPLVHVIGREAANEFKTITEAFNAGDAFCWSGYYHGVMEGMVKKIGLTDLSKGLNDICSQIPGRESYNFDYYNCVHGLGHGLEAYYEGEIFHALVMCDNLTGDWERQSCYSGVFMQNIIDSTNVSDTGGGGKYLKPEEPLYPCTAVEGRYKGQCYLGQTSYSLQMTSYDYKKVFDLCTTVETPYRDICNQSMGRDVANQAMHEKNRTKKLCSITKDSNDFNNCVVGAVKEIISYYHSDKEALEFCDVLSGEGKNICTSTAKSYYSNF